MSNTEKITQEMTERAKAEVARDFSTWLKSGGMDGLELKSFAVKQYRTERALAYFVARTTLALGDYVARGALIEFASTLSDYVEFDTFNDECVFALKVTQADNRLKGKGWGLANLTTPPPTL